MQERVRSIGIEGISSQNFFTKRNLAKGIHVDLASTMGGGNRWLSPSPINMGSSTYGSPKNASKLE